MEIEDLKVHFLKVRSRTESIVAPLEKEDFVPQPIMDVSPPKWHLAHTTWFFDYFILSKFQPDFKYFHPLYHYLFNSYYQGAGDKWSRDKRGDLSRPTVDEIFAYRKYVDENLVNLIENENIKKNDIEEVKRRLVLGCNHEQQHQELLISDIHRIWGENPLFPCLNEPVGSVNHPVKAGFPKEVGDSLRDFKEFENEYHVFESENGQPIIANIGRELPAENTVADFCYDNETVSHQQILQPFKMAKNLVKIGEFLQFVHDGGYEKPEYWHDDGWQLVQQGLLKNPMYLYHAENQLFHYNLQSGLQKVDVHSSISNISFYEAAAYAKWAGKRLPTEFEWEYAAQHIKMEKEGFQELGKLSHTHRTSGNQDFFGHLWQWTNSAYLPYPHYKAEEGALGEYNGKFMINQMVLRGGSFATPRSHFRKTYRNFFPPEKQFQFTGIRLAESI